MPELQRIARITGVPAEEIRSFREYPAEGVVVIVDRDYHKRRFPMAEPPAEEPPAEKPKRRARRG